MPLHWSFTHFECVICYQWRFAISSVEKQQKVALPQPKLSTNQSILTDKDIIHKVLGNSTDFSSDEDYMKVSEVEFIRKPLIEEVRRAIEMFVEFSLYSEFGEGIQSLSQKSINSSIGKNRKRENSRISQNFSRKLIVK